MKEKILIVTEGCPACEPAKKKAKVRVVEASTKEGRDLMKKLNFDMVPECVMVNLENNKARICTDEEWKDSFKK